MCVKMVDGYAPDALSFNYLYPVSSGQLSLLMVFKESKEDKPKLSGRVSAP